ncbi:MAG: pyruvate dehydrogenase complex dihydrolipoamide acetyltransferase [Sphingobacteriaceae bacterium]|nr:pyruvate dehydrogenase complex dihydrolipoamide acetyltransferase [Sphingobacteriaceae bacterium]
MAEVIRMPKMSDTMTEGVIAEWHKKEGDKVKPGDILADVETDKATMELENFESGTLLYIGVKKGEAVPVNAIIAIIGKEGEDIKALIASESAPDEAKTEAKAEAAPAKEAAPAPAAKAEAAPVAAPAAAPAPVGASSDDDRLKASPLARKIAEDKGIDLRALSGSGDGGRIVKRDLDNYTPAAASAPSFAPVMGQEKYTEVAVSQMRKTIARRLAESKFSAPHFYLTIDIDMDKAMAARTQINEVASAKVSFNDMVIKASALALRKHPKINSSWLGDKIRFNEHVNIGVAMAVEEGLLVPVVRFADGKPLSQIATEVKVFAGKAKEKKLQPSDWEGNTFTISNLGMFGIEEFTAIINPPDACIMAVGAIRQEPVVKNGQVVPGNRMKVTLSCDHRVVDGASGAEFLQTFKQLLEEPVRMLA